MTTDQEAKEIRELNRRMHEAFRPEGVAEMIYTVTNWHTSQFFSDPGRWNCEWSPATDLQAAVAYRPAGGLLDITINRFGSGVTLWVHELCFIGNATEAAPAAAVCLALLAWKEQDKSNAAKA